jgi:DtxR family transcriptional regulator, Mn-dependent transcriptional regulator
MRQHAQLKSGPLTPTRENYLRALYQLSRSGDSVRLTDLARSQGVRLPTARHFVNCLRDVGLAEQETYGRITLTHVGKRVGREISDRFELTRKFLIEVLGVPDGVAEREACVMEHHLDDDTLDRLATFVKHVTSCAAGAPGGLDCLANLRTDVKADARRA